MTQRVRSPSGKALYRVLPPKVRDMSAEQIAINQRGRLQGAMLAAVAKNGYQDTSIKQIVSLAGVSRTALYKHFENKETLFLSTFDLIVSMASERISRAYRSQTDWQAQMRASFTCFAEIVAHEPAAAHLVLVDALAAGDRALTRREAASQTFETMLAQSYAAAPEQASVSETTVRMVIAGIRHLAYRRLLDGKPEQLPELTEQILTWALCYHQPGLSPPADRPATKTAGTQGTAKAARPRARKDTHATPRQRILAAIIQIANQDGYAALSMPAIAKQAGASNESFYEHFADKQAAFLAAFWETTTRGITPSVQAFTAGKDWPTAVHASITVLLQTVAADPEFAWMAFFSILTAGRAGIDTANQALDQFATMFAPADKQRPAISAAISQALVGGLWATIARELTNGRQAQLPSLAPQITYIVLTPYLGAENAIEIARAPATV